LCHIHLGRAEFESFEGSGQEPVRAQDVMRGKKGFGHIGNIVFRMSFVNLEKTIDPGRAIIHNEYLTIKLALKRGRKVLLTSHEMSNIK